MRRTASSSKAELTAFMWELTVTDFALDDDTLKVGVVVRRR
jgi:hypothetical protein